MNAGLQGITVVGGVVPPVLLGRIQSGEVRDANSLRSGSYHLIGTETTRDAASRAWSYLRGAWEASRAADQSRVPGTPGTGAARERWLLPLLRELGYGQVQTHAGSVIIDEREYPISHEWNHVAIHLLGPGVDLDRRNPGVAGAARAPQAMIQEYLNRSPEHLWAILSNGLQFRLLRDSTALAGSAYLEFDLETIFEGELYPEFLLFWQLAQFSRLEKRGGPDKGPEDCWLESWRGEAVDAGTRALDKLRDGVETALEAMGTGVLKHPANRWLTQALRDGELTDREFHKALLRTVYRLLFCFVAEDRGALLDPSASAEASGRYQQYFSTARLRRLSRRRAGGPHPDLWQAQKVVLRALGGNGRPEIAVPALGGLFDPDSREPVMTNQPAADLILSAEIANADLLTAVRALAWVTVKTSRIQQVDYRHLGAEELGSVYESLLELIPRIDLDERSFTLEQLSGNERKTTGSYYTPPALVSALLDSALDPLLEDAVKNADSAAHAQQRLLALTVCDPACGSGGFLVAAARRIARRLAMVRSGEDEPTPADVQHALHDVVGRCVYGVDLNDLAAELAKVSLWLEALEPGKPLGFLDLRIRVGNSMLGTTFDLTAEGVPDDAFLEIEGDDRKYCAAIRKRNRLERNGQRALTLDFNAYSTAELAKQRHALLNVQGDKIEQVRSQAIAWESYERSQDLRGQRLIADAWCSAFVWPLNVLSADPPTDDVLRRIADGASINELSATLDEIDRLAREYRFFHWQLEFPEVFEPLGKGSTTEPVSTGGFSCLVGNPPWDSLSPDKKEFFSAYEPTIRTAKKADQDALVDDLLQSPVISDAWRAYRRTLFSTVHFIKKSGRYRLFAPGHLGKGDFNSYRMFVETSMQITRDGGAATQVLPDGFYGGANAMAIRQELYDHWNVQLVMGFVNTGKAWFQGVHSDASFCIYSALKGGSTEVMDVSFELRTTHELAAALKDPICLSVQTIREQSPIALAIPEVTDRRGLELAKRMYATWPKFGEHVDGYPLRRYQREIDMGTDRELFGDQPDGYPLYEGRMIDQYDHRAKAWRSGRGRAAVWEDLPFGDDRKAISEQWRVLPSRIPSKLEGRADSYRVGFGDVTGARNERSMIAALIPPGTICGHTVPTFTYAHGWEWSYMLFLAFANSFCLDFLIRKKVSLHMSYSVLDSAPIPRIPLDSQFTSIVGPLALRLTCTSVGMTEYWNSMVEYGWCERIDSDACPPGLMAPEARAEAQAEIDGAVARSIFGLRYSELDTILDTFSALRRKEESKYGSFRTKQLVLDAWSRAEEPGLGLRINVAF